AVGIGAVIQPAIEGVGGHGLVLPAVVVGPRRIGSAPSLAAIGRYLRGSELNDGRTEEDVCCIGQIGRQRVNPFVTVRRVNGRFAKHLAVVIGAVGGKAESQL